VLFEERLERSLKRTIADDGMASCRKRRSEAVRSAGFRERTNDVSSVRHGVVAASPGLLADLSMPGCQLAILHLGPHDRFGILIEE
jgi:hypothetical protein